MEATILLDLTRRYSEAHRRYHSIEHIADMLWRGRELDLSDEQILAIWYHDAIYEVPGEHNEAKSAELAVAQLTARGMDLASIDCVAQIVRDTQTHVATRPESALVIDLDLASLALPWPQFEENTRRIREEYAIFDDQSFARGQIAFPDAFLSRERIYQSRWGAAFEDDARRNMARLRELRATQL